MRDFTGAVAEMEQILATMGNIAEHTDLAWRRHYIDLRRDLQRWITALGTAADHCREIRERPDLAIELRKRLSRLRSALALHQANWPVISIDANDPGYSESSNAVHQAAISFGRLARKLITDSAVA